MRLEKTQKKKESLLTFLGLRDLDKELVTLDAFGLEGPGVGGPEENEETEPGLGGAGEGAGAGVGAGAGAEAGGGARGGVGGGVEEGVEEEVEEEVEPDLVTAMFLPLAPSF
jgi:hypothetical protein